MKKMIAYCGFSCNKCPIYMATLESDIFRKQKMRELIAAECTKKHKIAMHSEDITDCDGCRTESGILYSGCMNCEIRKCSILKNIESCALCSEYACEKLKKLILSDTHVQVRLELIRQSSKF